MRTRDTHRLKPGTKVRLTGKKLMTVPYLKFWANRDLYVHVTGPGGACLRTSKQVCNSTSYCFCFPREISLIKD